MPAIEPAGSAPHPSLQTTLTRRSLNFAGLLCCAGLLGYAWYVQGILRVDPCPLCIFQRVGVAAIGALFVMAWLHAPKSIGARIYGVLLAGAALLTPAVAALRAVIPPPPPDAPPAPRATPDYTLA